jgi:hypothetical protein
MQSAKGSVSKEIQFNIRSRNSRNNVKNIVVIRSFTLLLPFKCSLPYVEILATYMDIFISTLVVLRSLKNPDYVFQHQKQFKKKPTEHAVPL